MEICIRLLERRERWMSEGSWAVSLGEDWRRIMIILGTLLLAILIWWCLERHWEECKGLQWFTMVLVQRIFSWTQAQEAVASECVWAQNNKQQRQKNVAFSYSCDAGQDALFATEVINYPVFERVDFETTFSKMSPFLASQIRVFWVHIPERHPCLMQLQHVAPPRFLVGSTMFPFLWLLQTFLATLDNRSDQLCTGPSTMNC